MIHSGKHKLPIVLRQTNNLKIFLLCFSGLFILYVFNPGSLLDQDRALEYTILRFLPLSMFVLDIVLAFKASTIITIDGKSVTKERVKIWSDNGEKIRLFSDELDSVFVEEIPTIFGLSRFRVRLVPIAEERVIILDTFRRNEATDLADSLKSYFDMPVHFISINNNDT